MGQERSDKELIRAFRGCWRKKVYFSQDSAKQAARARGMRAYRCDGCDNWHLTTKGVP